MESSILRSWWWSRQGLDGNLQGQYCREALRRAGWSRSLGGASPYLGIFARTGASRQQIDKDIANLDIHELPSARDCTYVLPKDDFALGLRLAQGKGQDSELQNLRKFFNFSETEQEKLIQATLRALEPGPLDPKEIKDAVGDAARSLGEAGKKRGTSTTLPPVLGFLQTRGQIRRVPVDGRLDQQRYRYALWNPNPLEGFEASYEEALTGLGRRYFGWIGAATVANFQVLAGVSGKVAREALAPLGFVEAFPGSDMLAFPEDASALHAYSPPCEPVYNLLGSIDSLRLHRDDLPALIEPEDIGREVPGEKHPVPLGSNSSFECHLIVDRGRLIGFWLYDPDDSEIVWISFVPKTEALKAEVARTEAFVRDQLGDFRSFSLDSPKSRAGSLAMLRKLA